MKPSHQNLYNMEHVTRERMRAMYHRWKDIVIQRESPKSARETGIHPTIWLKEHGNTFQMRRGYKVVITPVKARKNAWRMDFHNLADAVLLDKVHAIFTIAGTAPEDEVTSELKGVPGVTLPEREFCNLNAVLANIMAHFENHCWPLVEQNQEHLDLINKAYQDERGPVADRTRELTRFLADRQDALVARGAEIAIANSPYQAYGIMIDSAFLSLGGGDSGSRFTFISEPWMENFHGYVEPANRFNHDPSDMSYVGELNKDCRSGVLKGVGTDTLKHSRALYLPEIVAAICADFERLVLRNRPQDAHPGTRNADYRLHDVSDSRIWYPAAA